MRFWSTAERIRPWASGKSLGKRPGSNRAAFFSPAETLLLEIHNIYKHFGGIHAVEDASFTIEQGSITGLIGPNGAGKTTLFNVIAGLYPADSGRVLFGGQDITGFAPHDLFAKGVLRTFQIAHEFSSLSVRENLVATAASHLVMAHPKGAKGRIVSSVKSGGMTPGDGRVLAALMTNDAKGTAKLVGKLVKKVKNPEDFTAVAETLAEVGVHDVAFKLSAKAIKRLGKLSGKAAKSGDSKAGIGFSASASRMQVVLDRSALGMFGAATDESESAKKRLKALKKLLKSTKKVGLGGSRKEVLKGLKAAAKAADSKKLKKAYKKAYKKLKKRKKR